MEKPPVSQASEEASKPNRRRTERIKLWIPIRVMCFGGSTGEFTEDTHTVIVNRDGALIDLQHAVLPEDTLRIINLENFREADFRVVGQIRLEGADHPLWGVECLEKDRALWDIEFPPPLDPTSPTAAALLECLSCKKQSLVVLSLIEADTLESAGTIQSHCNKCGYVRSWTFADITRRPKDWSIPAQPRVPTKLGTWDGKTERRKFRRLALKVRALVCTSTGEEEIGTTDNLSKGGLALCLRMTVALGDFVTVICPYSGSGRDFEQRAEVRYRAPHASGRNWFYGLRYTSG
jgi:hypothetical protein